MTTLTTAHDWPIAGAATPTLAQRWNAFAYDPFLALAERRGMAALRHRLLAAARGRVLEIGAGTGLNLAHYGAAVDELVLTEPEAGMVRRLRRRVEDADPGDAAPGATRVVPAPAESLPYPDGSFDVAVSTLVLCTVPDPVAAVGELRRVVRPGGQVLLVEHVLSDDRPGLARWQRRLRQPWRSFAAGCRADQDTAGLLEAAGLATAGLRRETWHGMPPLVQPLLVGAVTVPATSG
jgi:SAM-dependent methyltransferase